MKDVVQDEPKLPGTKDTPPSRSNLYAMLARHVPEAIDRLIDLMQNSRNDSIRMGAINTILNKCLPDIKAVELTGDNKEAIRVRIVVDNGNNNQPSDPELPQTASDIRPSE